MGTRSSAVGRAQRIGRRFLRTRRRTTHLESLDDGASAPDRLRKPLRLRAYRTGVSFFVSVVLVAQAAVLLPDLDTGWGGPKTWPIISYHMYSRSRAEGDVAEARPLIQATLADGRTVDLTPQALGLNKWDYRALVDRLIADDRDAVSLLQERYGARDFELGELSVRNFPVIVTRAGPHESAPRIVKRLPLDRREPAPREGPAPRAEPRLTQESGVVRATEAPATEAAPAEAPATEASATEASR